MASRLSGAIGHSRAPHFIVVLAVLLLLPSITVGFFSDDYFFLVALEHLRAAPAFHDLYQFTPPEGTPLRTFIEAGVYPWWTTDDLHIRLVRPLSSILFAFDHRLFGRFAPGYHATSIAWFVILLGVTWTLYRRIVDRPTAVLALALLAFSPGYAMPPRWLAARHLIIAAIGAFTGLLLVVEGERKPWLRIAALFGFLWALAAGEAGLGSLALWLSYEWLGPHGRKGNERLRRGALPAGLGIAYLLAYSALGAGVRGGDAYLDPHSDPRGFLEAVASRAPLLLGDAILFVPAELGPVAPIVLLLTGVVATGAVAWLIFRVWKEVPARERAALRWIVPGSLVALAGTCGGLPGGRELAIPGLGLCLLFAVLIHRALLDPRPGTSGWEVRCLAAGLAAVQIVLGPLSVLAGAESSRATARSAENAAHDLGRLVPEGGTYFILAAADPLVWLYSPTTLLALEPNGHRCGAVVSTSSAPHRLRRTSDGPWLVESQGSQMLTSPFERLFRPLSMPVRPGMVTEQCGGKIRVVEVRDHTPTRLELDLGSVPTATGVTLLVWEAGRLRRIEPREAEEGAVIAWSPGPMGLL